MRKVLLSLLSVILLSSCAKTRIKEHQDWSGYFDQYGIKNACFILRDNNHESIHYFNKQRCTQRFTPASTFKVLLSLVALETAVAPDDQLVIKWDSVQRRPDWDKDLTLRDALTVSSEPYFKELARRIGPTRLQHYVDTVKYGNMTLSGKIDEVWTNNSIQISADEQIGFLKKMYFSELPFQDRTQRIVKTMMLREDSAGFKMYYKTGTAPVGDKNIYWLVGFVERVEHVKEPEGSLNKTDVRNYPYFFAENFEMPVADSSKNWLNIRIDIAHRILREYGAIH